jgi:hypothetical protein
VCCTCVQHRGEVDIDSMCKDVSSSIVATREARLPVHMLGTHALHYAPHPVLLCRAKLLHNFKCVDEAWFSTELQMLSLVTITLCFARLLDPWTAAAAHIMHRLCPSHQNTALH